MDVTIYTTPTCPWCRKVKELFNKNKIKYKEIDVASDTEAAQAMIKKSGQTGVPVSVIDGEVIVGFDEPRLRKALKLAEA